MKFFLSIISSLLLLQAGQAQLQGQAGAVRRLRSKNNNALLQIVEKTEATNMFDHHVADRELLSRLLHDGSMSMSMYH